MDNIWLYWENLEGRSTPDHIKLCVDTICRHAGGMKVVVLNESSPEVKDILKEGFPVGLPIALKADVIRANLLYRYGGICLDADIIIFRDLSSILELFVEGVTFIGFEDELYKARLGVMASKPKSSIVDTWVRLQREKLNSSKKFQWTSLGCDLLWKTTIMFPQEYYGVNMDLFYPIQWFKKESDKFFCTSDVSEFGDDLYGVQLFGKMTFDRLSSISREELINSDMLVSKLFRRSLSK